ncbi:hypothetical protein Pelo_8963 [Pelomyxa schiedti]|nr:hypothetical protein Pelo_8963 [Pelomyxa schiedti]
MYQPVTVFVDRDRNGYEEAFFLSLGGLHFSQNNKGNFSESERLCQFTIDVFLFEYTLDIDEDGVEDLLLYNDSLWWLSLSNTTCNLNLISDDFKSQHASPWAMGTVKSLPGIDKALPTIIYGDIEIAKLFVTPDGGLTWSTLGLSLSNLSSAQIVDANKDGFNEIITWQNTQNNPFCVHTFENDTCVCDVVTFDSLSVPFQLSAVSLKSARYLPVMNLDLVVATTGKFGSLFQENLSDQEIVDFILEVIDPILNVTYILWLQNGRSVFCVEKQIVTYTLFGFALGMLPILILISGRCTKNIDLPAFDNMITTLLAALLMMSLVCLPAGGSSFWSNCKGVIVMFSGICLEITVVILIFFRTWYFFIATFFAIGGFVITTVAINSLYSQILTQIFDATLVASVPLWGTAFGSGIGIACGFMITSALGVKDQHLCARLRRYIKARTRRKKHQHVELERLNSPSQS